MDNVYEIHLVVSPYISTGRAMLHNITECLPDSLVLKESAESSEKIAYRYFVPGGCHEECYLWVRPTKYWATSYFRMPFTHIYASNDIDIKSDFYKYIIVRNMKRVTFFDEKEVLNALPRYTLDNMETIWQEV